jgi:hypothetical protein
MKPTELDESDGKALDRLMLPRGRIVILGTGLVFAVGWMAFLGWATAKILHFL